MLGMRLEGVRLPLSFCLSLQLRTDRAPRRPYSLFTLHLQAQPLVPPRRVHRHLCPSRRRLPRPRDSLPFLQLARPRRQRSIPRRRRSRSEQVLPRQQQQQQQVVLFFRPRTRLTRSQGEQARSPPFVLFLLFSAPPLLYRTRRWRPNGLHLRPDRSRRKTHFRLNFHVEWDAEHLGSAHA